MWIPDSRRKIIFSDGSNHNMCIGACPSAMVCNRLLSGVSSVALQIAMGGPMVKFIESFEFPWVDWGCCSFIDPVFSYDNR